MTIPRGERNTERVDFDERKGAVDALHVLLMLSTAGVLATLWFLRLIDVDVTRLGASFALVIALQFLVSTALDRTHRVERKETLLVGLHLSTVLFLLYAWHLAGSLDIPVFLVAFSIPVITAHLVGGRGQAYVTATVAVTGVVLVACFADPELRWFLEQRGVPAGWLGGDGARPRAYVNVDAPPAFHVAGLTLFASLLFVLAASGNGALRTIVRIRERYRASEGALVKNEGLFQSALAETPSPAAIAFGDSLQILHVSRSFLQRMLLEPEDVPGKRLTDLVAFEESEDVAEWLTSSPEGSRVVAYRVGPQERVAEVHAASFAHDGVRHLRVELREFDAPRHLESALQASRDAVFLVGRDAQLYFRNAAATRLFGELHVGSSAARLLAVAGIPLHPARGDEDARVQFPHDIDERSFLVRVENLTSIGGELMSLVCLTPQPDSAHAGDVRPESVLDLYSARSFNEKLVRELAGSADSRSWSQASLGLAALVTDGRWAEPDEVALEGYLRALEPRLGPGDFVAVLREGRISVFFSGRSVAEGGALLEAAEAAWRTSDARVAGRSGQRVVIALGAVSPRADLDELTRQAEAELELARTREERSTVRG